MAINARYVHTNLIAGDWKKLVRFYRDVFGCIPRGPERDLSGEWLDRVTSLSAARLGGVHLRLPGYGDTGPTLEIFSYEDMSDKQLPMPNEPGFAHVAFAVDDCRTGAGNGHFRWRRLSRRNCNHGGRRRWFGPSCLRERSRRKHC
jgi:catechol 2,3-dioxygenase-like lactoylglutathione lyase family enzyme